MVGTVIKGDFEVDDREADERTGFCRFAHALFDRGDIFLGNVTALDFVLEGDARATLTGLNGELDAAELTRTTRLLFVRVVDIDFARQIFAVGHLGCADIGFHLEFATHTVNDDVEVKFAHALDDRLTRFMVGRYAERGIFSRQTVERDAHLFLVSLGLGFHRQFDNRLREFHTFQNDREAFGAQRVTGGRFLHTGKRDDVACKCFVNVLTFIGVHFEHAADFFLLVLHRVQIGALGQGARIDTDEGQRTDERVVHDLEGECRERRFVRRRTAVLLVAVHLHALNIRNVERRRQIVDNGVEQRLNALVLERRTAANGHERLVQRPLADQLLHGRNVRLIAVEIGFHGVVVLLDDQFDQFVAIFRSFVGEVGGDIFVEEFCAQAFILPDDRTVFNEVDKTLQIRLKADRNVENRRLRTQTIDDRLHAIFEVRAGPVELVDEAHARNAIFVSLTPYGFRLRLHTGNAVEACNRTVENAQRTLDFNGEVNVAGGVDDVDAVIVPEAGRRSRGDGDTTLLFLLHPVHGGRTIVHFTDLVRLAGVVKDTLGGRGLTGVDMRHNTDIAIHIEWMAACHGLYSEVWAANTVLFSFPALRTR